MSRKRKRKTPAPKKASASLEQRIRIHSFRLRMELTALELASGHDGLLRGLPEPVILLGVFLVANARALPLGRCLVRMNPPVGRFPLTVTPPQPAVLRAKGRASASARIAVLAIAVEEDAGKDVERIYAHLAEGKNVRVWNLEDAVPSPTSLAELVPGPEGSPVAASALLPHPVATRVGVVVDGAELRDVCEDDELVGASLFLIPTTRQEEGFRVHFTSGDKKNDWTALISVSVE
ncbi:MAG TPA: hypothetical protein VK459_20000 [Polyangiaceae bacterium]|jgi:hypothetical protein|nr:hypothetical protein [Polyangiaceae bacterium]